MTAIDDSADKSREIDISGVIHVGDKGGPLELVCTLDGEICPCLPFRTHKARRLASLTSILKDLGQVRAALVTLVKHAETKDEEWQIINQCLWFSAVVTYRKCFTSGSGRTVTLNETKDMRGVTAEQKGLHKEMIETRNEYVAHAGETKAEQAVTLLFLHPDPSKKSVVAVSPLSIAEMRIPPTKLVGVLRLVEKVIGNVDESRRKALESVRKEANEAPIDDLYKRAIVPKAENLVWVEQLINVPPAET